MYLASVVSQALSLMGFGRWESRVNYKSIRFVSRITRESHTPYLRYCISNAVHVIFHGWGFFFRLESKKEHGCVPGSHVGNVGNEPSLANIEFLRALLIML